MQRHGWWMVCALLILVVLGYCGPGAVLQAGGFKKTSMIEIARQAVSWAEAQEVMAKKSMDTIQAACAANIEAIRKTQNELQCLIQGANQDNNGFTSPLGIPAIDVSRCALRDLQTASPQLGASLERAQVYYGEKVAQRQAAQEYLENLTVQFFASVVTPTSSPRAGIRVV